MSSPVISVENLSKSYLIGHQGPRERYTSLRDTLARGTKSILRKTRDLATGKQMLQGDSIEEFWALKDVSFEVKQGEVLGIIGRNGAGKSTLLKVLSRITEPTSGRVELAGRVASLLEVGTGFHPELTGRENVFLNGAILGMAKREIRQKFDEIIDFAGVEKFLDTPVKRYSSGMYVRLAFSVAAHLEPEILVVDEVLAVGDAEFQRKCMGKMQQVALCGRTVLFVSHSMAAIGQLCTRTILMNSGGIVLDSSPHDGIEAYLTLGASESEGEIILENTIEGFWLRRVGIYSAAGRPSRTFMVQDAIQIRFEYEAADPPQGIELSFIVTSARGNKVFSTDRRGQSWPKGITHETCEIPKMFLTPGAYTISIVVHIPGIMYFFQHEHALGFTIEETGSGMELYNGADYGSVLSPVSWSMTESQS